MKLGHSLRIDIGLQTKKFLVVNFERVNIAGSEGLAFRAYKSNLKEEDKYLDHEIVCFQDREKGNQGQNCYGDR